MLRGSSRLAASGQLHPTPSTQFLRRRSNQFRHSDNTPASRRTATTSTTASADRVESEAPPSPGDAPPSNPPSEVDRQRTKKTTKKLIEPKEQRDTSSTLPSGLDIFWNCSDWHPSSPKELPPDEVLQDALNNLHICFHPQAQRRSLYSSGSGSGPVEPTLALYCPIEGGDYLLDNTIRELARRTGSEVLVLDSVQLAAGEWGCFGEGTAVLRHVKQLIESP